MKWSSDKKKKKMKIQRFCIHDNIALNYWTVNESFSTDLQFLYNRSLCICQAENRGIYYWKTNRLVSNPADANIFNSMGSLSHRVSYWLWGKVKMFMIFKVIFGYSNLRRCEENVFVLFLSIFRPFLLIFVVWFYGSQIMFFFFIYTYISQYYIL